MLITLCHNFMEQIILKIMYTAILKTILLQLIFNQYKARYWVT